MANLRAWAAGAAAVAAVGIALLWSGPAAAHEGRPGDQGPGREIVLDGLRPGSAGSCRGAYEVATDVAAGPTRCTHGPDAAPPGVDVAAEAVPLVSPDAEPALECYGTGSDGLRVQAVYAVAADRPDRYGSLVATVRQNAKNVDKIFLDSAAATGGTRHVRFVTGAGCVADVAHVVMSSTGDDDFSNTIDELAAKGFDRTDRKYLIWVDANVYCGIANVNPDDRKAATNRNNRGPDYARADAGCWGGHTEAHELMHTLGGVQLSAPHSSGGYHCVDEYDVMCYSDSPGYPAMQYRCVPSSPNESLFDCGHDDYFHTNPSSGNYLATYWNSADNAFLAAGPSGDDRGPPDIHLDTGQASRAPPAADFRGPSAPPDPVRRVGAHPSVQARQPHGSLASLALAAWARRVGDACRLP